MQSELTINLNGTFYSSGKIISSGNRSFLYGDGIFETIRAHELTIPLWPLHYARLIKAAAVLGYDMPPWWDQDYFYFEIIKTLKENRLSGGRVRLTLFREEGGSYTPQSDRPAYLIQANALEGSLFELGDGLEFGVCNQVRSTPHTTSDFKTTSSLHYVLAARQARREGWDLGIILDQKDNLSETTTGNLVLVKEDRLFTPTAGQGAIKGIMQAFLLPLLEAAGMTIERKSIPISELELADEIWSINALRGIQWAKKCNLRDYKNEWAIKAQDILIKNTEIHAKKTT